MLRKRRFHFSREGKIEARDNPRGSALKKVELADARGDLRNELDGAGASANDGDVFPAKVHAVIPA